MFEADLRFKVDSKCPSGQMEDRFLIKSFQFFDFRRCGAIDFTQFYKTLERVGVIATKSNAEKIFYQLIDMGFGEDGQLDYKKYAKKVYNPSAFDPHDVQVHKPLATAVYETAYPMYDPNKEAPLYTESKPSPAKSTSSHAPIKRSKFIEATSDTVDSIIDELRQRIKMRGAKGFIGLQRQFKGIDKNNEGTVNQFEFSKVLREFDLNLLESQYNVLFNAFDKRKNGQIDYLAFKSKY